MNYSRQGKHRRLWRLAVATQPPIAADYLLKGHVSIRHPLQASEVAQLAVGVRDGDENFMSDNKKQMMDIQKVKSFSVAVSISSER